MYSMYSNLLSLTISELKGFPITTVQEQFSRSYTTHANNPSIISIHNYSGMWLKCNNMFMSSMYMILLSVCIAQLQYMLEYVFLP